MMWARSQLCLASSGAYFLFKIRIWLQNNSHILNLSVEKAVQGKFNSGIEFWCTSWNSEPRTPSNSFFSSITCFYFIIAISWFNKNWCRILHRTTKKDGSLISWNTTIPIKVVFRKLAWLLQSSGFSVKFCNFYNFSHSSVNRISFTSKLVKRIVSDLGTH